jgi:hypothetical protein
MPSMLNLAGSRHYHWSNLLQDVWLCHILINVVDSTRCWQNSLQGASLITNGCPPQPLALNYRE